MKHKSICFTINELNMFYDAVDAHKEKNFNKAINLIDIIIKEFYEILNKNSMSEINAENEKELEYF